MTLHGGTLGFDVMDQVMARVHPFGWHANIQLDGRELPKYEAQIKRLPGKFVIDHTGKFLEPVAVDSQPFRSLLNLVETGRCWVKLSAPYETSKTGAPKYEDVGKTGEGAGQEGAGAHAVGFELAASSVPKEKRPADEDLLDLLLDWAPLERPQEDTRRQPGGALWLLRWGWWASAWP